MYSGNRKGFTMNHVLNISVANKLYPEGTTKYYHCATLAYNHAWELMEVWLGSEIKILRGDMWEEISYEDLLELAS
jgi:hypothetical protein